MELRNEHLLDAYATRGTGRAGLIVFNYDLHQSHTVVLDGLGTRQAAPATVAWLHSSSPAANNESITEVTATPAAPFSGPLSLPPCSMAVVEWKE